jgi:DNA-directed RNA polymerase subunit RPC12/RpoP
MGGDEVSMLYVCGECTYVIKLQPEEHPGDFCPRCSGELRFIEEIKNGRA